MNRRVEDRNGSSGRRSWVEGDPQMVATGSTGRDNYRPSRDNQEVAFALFGQSWKNRELGMRRGQPGPAVDSSYYRPYHSFPTTMHTQRPRGTLSVTWHTSVELLHRTDSTGICIE